MKLNKINYQKMKLNKTKSLKLLYIDKRHSDSKNKGYNICSVNKIYLNLDNGIFFFMI